MKDILHVRNLMPESPGQRRVCGRSSIIQSFTRAHEYTHAPPGIRGEAPLEVLLLLKFLPLSRDARAALRVRTRAGSGR